MKADHKYTEKRRIIRAEYVIIVYSLLKSDTKNCEVPGERRTDEVGVIDS